MVRAVALLLAVVAASLLLGAFWRASALRLVATHHEGLGLWPGAVPPRVRCAPWQPGERSALRPPVPRR